MRTSTLRRAAAIGVIVVAAAVFTTVAVGREDAILALAYGNGVHAYYAGDYQRSFEELSAAIEGGTQDPRALYFRGLAALRLGRFDEAEADFALGANAEAAGRGNWAVGRSLERIQGEPRMLLEKHRVRARMAAAQQRREAIVRHYSNLETVRPDVQRSRRPENLPGMPTPAADASQEPADAPAPASIPAAPITEEEEAPEPQKSTDPFGDDPF